MGEGARRKRGGDAPDVHVWLFRSFRIQVDGAPVPDAAWKLRKAKHLVKLLALAPGHQLHRERVMDLLWPDADAEGGADSFRQALLVARRALAQGRTGRSPFLVVGDNVVSLYPAGPLWTDVEEFGSRLATARARRDPGAYEAALEMYEGELLAEDRYEDWAAERREALRGEHLAALVEVAQLHEERRDAPRAIAAFGAAVAADPTNEAAHVALMRLHALSGGRRRALEQYERLRSALRAELDAEPDAAAQRLRRDILEGRFPTASRAAPVTAPARHNLPAPLTSFIGRDREKARVRDLLAEARLVTLTGPGGCGKTRLALEVAAGLTDRYADGAWLVELDALADAALVPQGIASALRLRDGTVPSSALALAERLRDRRLLLILDSCEHLVPAVARSIDALLRSVPGLRILATSRSALGIRGESLWAVPPLELPPEDGALAIDELARYEAIRLFAERARFANPAFAVNARNGAAVARICRRLDGLPLAIELAAAHARTLTAERIAARLDDRFRLLTKGDRAAPERHQTLRAVVDWSYDRLDARQRSLFSRLGVFAGGWTLEAAEAVAAGQAVAPNDVLDLLSQLVDHSLVVVESTADEDVRYRMLETIRAYARELLARSDDAAAVDRRHAAFFRALAEEAATELAGARQAGWLDRLEQEHDNIRAALEWSLRTPDLGIGLRIGAALGQFWLAHGHLSEGRRWLTRLLQASPTEEAPRAQALGAAALLASEMGDNAGGHALLEESIAIHRRSSSEAALAGALSELGIVCRREGDVPSARRALEESIGIQRRLGQERGVAAALRGLGLVACEQGDLATAWSSCEESLAIERRLENERGIANALNSLGNVAHIQGRLEAAASLYEEALLVSREVGSEPELLWSLSDLGALSSHVGELASAHAYLDEGLRTAEAIGDDVGVAAVVLDVAAFALARGELERGYRLAAAASRMREALGAPLALRQLVHQRALEAARERLGAVADGCWREGRAMGGAHARADAASVLREARPAPA